MRMPLYALNPANIKKELLSLCNSKKGLLIPDRQTISYYANGGDFLWTDRYGINPSSDTLLAHIKTVEAMGFAIEAFHCESIENDMKRVRTLDFDDDENTGDKVLARLEYHLTNAYLRYSTGQRFGFTNPSYLFNRLDTLDNPSKTFIGYRRLFDIKTERPDDAFFAGALRQINNDSIGHFLRQIQPHDSMYYRLQKELQKDLSADYHKKVLCNMERCRWREVGKPQTNGKHIVVNIPAYHLYAHNGDSVLDMRIACGARKSKTPLLTSHIERMEVNPIWSIPQSIIRKEVSAHAGDTSYFARHRYYIVKRESGEQTATSNVTAAMLQSGEYGVRQEGGAGNSLGRIIFRFANNFSVFLHDTSSPGVFSHTSRSVSHGCVRVQKPFDLAVFLLSNHDEWLLDRLRISMDIPPVTDRGKKYIKNEENNRKLVKVLQVNPHVPLFITYHTIFPNEHGRLTAYPDVYGYDEVIYQSIKPFLN